MDWMTTRGNKKEVMAKKKKAKKAKPLPAPKKQQISMRPEERLRQRQEIKEILLNAEKEKETQILERKKSNERTFTNEQINTFLKGLKFKSEEENKKPGLLPKIASTIKNLTGKGKDSTEASSETVTNTYYERWFRLVSTKPTVFEESQPEEIIKVEHKPLPKGVSSTVRATYDLYKKELMVDEIAKRRKLSVGTIYGHFCQLVGMGAVSIYELLSNSKIKYIASAIKKVGKEKMSEIKSQCPSSITYDDIKLMLSHFKKKKDKL